MGPHTPSGSLGRDVGDIAEQYSLLMECVTDYAIFLLDPQGRVATWNTGAERIFGYTPAEAVGMPASRFFTPEQVEQGLPQRELWAAATDGRAGDDRWLVRKDGTRIWVNGTLTALKNEAGDLRGFAKVCRDITEQKQAQEASARDALLLANVRDSVIVTDLEGVITYWNEGATRLFGWMAEEMLGRPLTDRLPEEARAEAQDWMGRIRAGAEFEGECQDYHKDGSRIWIHARTSLIKDSGGRPIAIMGLSHDISERRRLEEQLHQSQKMEAIGQLAGGVAHDFNNLLCIINGYSDIVYSALRPDDPLRNLVDEIRKAGERSASLTRQLLAFSRKQVIVPKVLDLNEVVSEMGKLLLRAIGEDIELVLHLQPGLAPIHADPGQMEQVILNLAVNARDAMPQGGRLVVQTGNVELDEGYARRHAEVVAGPYVLLELRDTGCGMTPVVKAHLFEPFFTTKEVGKGTGLGLAVVHGVVSQSGGYIEVDSEPGRGTSFKIYLPRAQPTNHPTTSVAEVKVAPRGSETVLLVEDAQAVREVNRRILVRGGYAVLEACDGQEALRVAGQHRGPIHLLLTDVVMPAMGGRQLAEHLSGLHPSMKVLYVSGYPDDAVVEHGIREGEVHFLQKPFSPSVLTQKVRDVLDAP
jgi:two-component system cell cycle sensor histidine kinase/response regulator CckA